MIHNFEPVSISLGYILDSFQTSKRLFIQDGGVSARGSRQNMPALHANTQGATRVQQFANALNRIFKSNLSLNDFKWLLTKLELLCVRNIIPRSRKRLWNGHPVLNQKLQKHNPVGWHIPVLVMYGSTPPPPAPQGPTLAIKNDS